MKLLRLVEQFTSVDLGDLIIYKLIGKSSENFQESYLNSKVAVAPLIVVHCDSKVH